MFFIKKLLKGSKCLITEVLPKNELNLFKITKTHFKNACWTMGGKIYVSTGGTRVQIKSENYLKTIVTQSISSVSVSGGSDHE